MPGLEIPAGHGVLRCDVNLSGVALGKRRMRVDGVCIFGKGFFTSGLNCHCVTSVQANNPAAVETDMLVSVGAEVWIPNRG